MKIGKISNKNLKELVFNNLEIDRKEVLDSSEIGSDCAVLDFDGDLLVTSVDPITGASENIGYLAVIVSCNDAYCMRAEPVGILMSVLLPKDIKKSEIKKIIRDAQEAAKKIGVNIIGGHTEITDVVKNVVITSTVLARAKKSDLPRKDLAKVGDRILISKYVGLEGSSILAHDFKDKLEDVLTKDELVQAQLYKHLMSVRDESIIAKDFNVRMLHDITEGGVLGAVHEVATNLGFGAKIFYDKIPVTEVTKKITKFFNIDPLRFISSGSMMLIVPENEVDDIIKEASLQELFIREIGYLTEKDITMIKNGREIKIGEPKPDELYKVV